jgi:hypothetical protein
MSCFQKGVLSLAALSVTALSFAATDMETRVRELEKEMKEVRSQTAAKTYGAYATTARPENDGKGFFVTFDVLYWQSLVDGTQFAYSQGCDAYQTLPLNSDVRQITFNKWDWGFRAGAGYKFNHGEWDVYANFTYFKNSSDLTVGDGILTTILNETMAVKPSELFSSKKYYQNAVSSFKFSFNRLDLELGRDFYVSKFLSMRPHIGLMTAWINEQQTTKFTGGSIGYNTIELTNEDKFWGVGPRTGINTTWHLCNGFSLIGNTSGAFVYGNYKLQKHQCYSYPTMSDNAYNLYDSLHRFSPTGQLQLGLRYDRYTTDCKQHFSAFLAWDIQYWWNLYRYFPADSIISSNNDVSLQGATLNLRLDF